MQHVFFAMGDHRMAGVVAALGTDHDIGIPHQVIDNFSLALVTPLQTGNNGVHQFFSNRNLLHGIDHLREFAEEI